MEAMGYCTMSTTFPRYSSTLHLEHLSKVTASRAAVEEAANAISWVHGITGLASPTAHQAVQAIVEGARRLLAKPKVRKEPLTVRDLQKMVRCCLQPAATLSALRTVSMFLLSFAAFLHFDEMVNLKCGDVKVTGTHLELRICKSKTDQYREGNTVIVARTHSSTCPVATLERYMREAKITLSRENHLYSGITRTKRGEVLYTCVRELVRQSCRQAGLDPSLYGVHSLRAGGATAGANIGIPDRAFKLEAWKMEV